MTKRAKLSRRSFLTGRFFGGQPTTPATTTPAVRHMAIPVHRPPGAIAETSFLDTCTRCGDCIAACPHDAIVIADARLRSAAGTPIIDADHAPCRMCEGQPCIAACEPRALSPSAPQQMATVAIEPWACLAHSGTFCSVCVEQCPVPGAIRVTSGRPEIVAEHCTGCGVCRFVCPAPENAILLMPKAVER